MANNLDTIPYEVLTGISSRVKRIYHKEYNIMQLTQEEQDMRNGKYGEVYAEAIDYIIQLGEAFDAGKTG